MAQPGAGARLGAGDGPRLPPRAGGLLARRLRLAAQERRLNRLDHFLPRSTASASTSSTPALATRDALPLVLSHGWPGSVVEFLDVIGPLTDPPDPADAFHVVAPSLPGYGFSGPVSEPRWHPRRIADAFTALMARSATTATASGRRLGVDREPEHGGPRPRPRGRPAPQLRHRLPPSGERDQELDPEERASVERLAAFQATGAGYSAIQGTKPQTLGYALDDSPTGLAAWIVEKFRAWSDCGGDVERSFTKDQLLTNVTLYWLTRTATSSARLYYEMRKAGRAALPRARRRPDRRRQLPGRDRAATPAVGRAPLPGHALGRPAPGRPLRGDGGARPVRRRPPRVLPHRPRWARRRLMARADVVEAGAAVACALSARDGAPPSAWARQ